MAKPQLYIIHDLAKILGKTQTVLKNVIKEHGLNPYCYIGRYDVYELGQIKALFRDQEQKEYIKKRDELIEQAEKHADAFAGKRPKGDTDEWACSWNKAYSKEMDRLAREAGLI